MATIPDSLMATIVAQWTGAGGAIPTGQYISEDFTTTGLPARGGEYIWINSLFKTTPETVNDKFEHRTHVVYIKVNTSTSADRRKEVGDEVVRILNSKAIAGVNIQKVTDRTRIRPELVIGQQAEMIKVTLREFMVSGAVAYGASTISAFTTDELTVNTSIEGRPTAELGNTSIAGAITGGLAITGSGDGVLKVGSPDIRGVGDTVLAIGEHSVGGEPQIELCDAAKSAVIKYHQGFGLQFYVNGAAWVEALRLFEDGTVWTDHDLTVGGDIAVTGTVDGVDIAARDHARYTDAEAIAAVVAENPLALTSSLNIGASTTITSILDEDAMGSNSATALCTQQSIVAYVDGSGGHRHDGNTLQHDGVNSDGGAFAFDTTGVVTFNQNILTDGDLTVSGNCIYNNGVDFNILAGSGVNANTELRFDFPDITTTYGRVRLFRHTTTTNKSATGLQIFDASGNNVQMHMLSADGNAVHAGDLTVGGGDIISGITTLDFHTSAGQLLILESTSLKPNADHGLDYGNAARAIDVVYRQSEVTTSYVGTFDNSIEDVKSIIWDGNGHLDHKSLPESLRILRIKEQGLVSKEEQITKDDGVKIEGRFTGLKVTRGNAQEAHEFISDEHYDVDGLAMLTLQALQKAVNRIEILELRIEELT